MSSYWLNPGSRRVKYAEIALVLLSLVAIGWIDFASGTEIRILALYYIPLFFAGWRMGKTGAVISALLATTIWLSALYGSGIRFQNPFVWVINTFATATGFLVVSVLVALLHKALDRESTLSRTDQLTNLPNRRFFIEIVTSKLALCKRAARAATLVSIDLNNFKHANDTYGHQRGDEILRVFAGILLGSVRASDSVARIGGDEFVIFLPDADAKMTAPLIERIRQEAESTPEFQASGVTLSIGVASELPVVSDLDSLLRAADSLMYEEKRRRKSTIKSE